MANGWTMERRQRQAEIIKQWQPWKHSKGARTAQGKIASSQNAKKDGMSNVLKEMRLLLKQHRNFIEQI